MPIRITGLNSGLDTESIISALVSAYSYKKDKYVKAQTKLSWKQDAWKSLNIKIRSLYDNVGNYRFTSAYNLKSTTVSDATKATINATSTAVNGSYSIQITSLAKAGYLTGGQLKSGTTGSSKLSELGVGSTGTISATVGGKTTDISVTADTTINEFVAQLKDAGVNASYDETNRRIFVSAKSTGVENDFVLTGGDTNGTSALTAMGLSATSKAATEEYNKLAAYNYTAADIADISQKKSDAAVDNIALAELNTKYSTLVGYTNASNGILSYKSSGTDADFNLLRDLSSRTSLADTFVDDAGNVFTKDSTSGKYTSTTGTAEYENTDTLKSASDKLNELAISFGMSKEEKTTTDGVETTKTVVDTDKLTAFKTNLATVKKVADEMTTSTDTFMKDEVAKIDSLTTTDEFATKVESYQSSIAANNASITSNNATISADPDIKADMTTDEVNTLLDKIAYAKEVVAGTITLPASAGATRIDGEDATIYVNGAVYTGNSNNFSINGLSITATGITGTSYSATNVGAIQATVNTDTQGIYDKVKDFITQYNSLINEMTSLYNADSAKGYDPLTSDEKDAMSDTEVEKWEDKIKSALLRRDDTLSSVMNAMTMAMSKGIEIDGKNYYLSTFGISTLGYLNAAKNEQNAYHIYGDSDDSTTSGDTDKLMAAINTDPEAVITFMKGLATNLYNAVDAKMKTSTLKSTYTVYNDKEMASEYSDYTDLISKWEEKLTEKEDYYYNKFSSMETALSKLNSQTSSLSGLFG